MDQDVKIAHGEKRKVPFPLQLTFLPLKQSMIHPIAMSLLPNKSELLAYKRITNSSSIHTKASQIHAFILLS